MLVHGTGLRNWVYGRRGANSSTGIKGAKPDEI